MTKKSQSVPVPVTVDSQPTSKMLDMPQALAGYLASALDSLDLALISASPEQAWSAANRGLAMEAAGKILAGRALIHLRESMDSKAFSGGLAERGIARRTAYDAIATYELFSSLPDTASVRALAHIGITKAMSLSRWPAEAVRALAHGEEINGLTLEQAGEMTSRELDALAKAALLKDDERARLESENLRLKAERDQLVLANRRRSALEAEEDLPPFAREARGEGMKQSEQIGLCIETLEDVAQRTLLDPEISHPERLRWQPIAARTLAHALGAQLLRGAELISRLREHFGEALMNTPDIDTALGVGELQQFAQSRNALVAAHAATVKARADDRANSTPGKRGAKRGVK